MEPVNFLKDRLENLALHFPQVQIKYAYNASIATHIVELTPEAEYYFNEALDKMWIPISIEFMETFPTESISFISSDSNLAIDKGEFEWNKHNIEWEPIMNDVFNDVLQNPFEFEFPVTVERTKAPVPNVELCTIHTVHRPIAGLATAVSVQTSSGPINVHLSEILAKAVAAGNTQYAMAA